MTKHLKNFVKGVGSVLDIAPSEHFSRRIPKGSDADRLQGDLQRIGQDMYRSMDKLTRGRRTKS
jgi:hypothetical protein